MGEEDLSFTIINDKGLEVKCDTLSIIGPEEGQEFFEPYIIYTDYTLDTKGLLNVYVAQISGNGDDYELNPVENYEDIEAIQKELERIFAEENSKLN